MDVGADQMELEPDPGLDSNRADETRPADPHATPAPGSKLTVEELLAVERGRRRFRRLVLALVLLTILSVIGGVWYAERGLTQSVAAVLEGSGIEGVQVELNGRDVVLSGELQALAPVPALVEAVAAVPGVRTVRSELRLAPPVAEEPEVDPEPVVLDDPVLGIRFQETGVVLSGTMPSEAAIDVALAQARQVFGFAGVVNHLQTGEVSDPQWLQRLWEGAFAPDIQGDYTIDVSSGVARLVGTVPTQEMRTRVQSRLADAVAGQLTIQSRLEVDDLRRPSAACTSVVEKSVVAADTLFGPGSAVLAGDGTSAIDGVLEVLLTCPQVDIEIAVHTDSQGSVGDNLALSQAQAEAIAQHLVAGGVGANRLTATGYGEAVPVADNEAEEGRRENRRVEFIPRGDD